jgi:hypothetical protein
MTASDRRHEIEAAHNDVIQVLDEMLRLEIQSLKDMHRIKCQEAVAMRDESLAAISVLRERESE